MVISIGVVLQRSMLNTWLSWLLTTFTCANDLIAPGFLSSSNIVVRHT